MYHESVIHFQFIRLLIALLAVSLGLTLLNTYHNKHKIKFSFYNGLSMYLLFSFLLFITIGIQLSLLDFVILPNSLAYLSIWWNLTLVVIGILGFIVLPSYSLGKAIIDRCFYSISKREQAIVAIALGLVFITFFLFILGSIGLLYQWIVIAVLLLPALIFWRNSLSLLHTVTIRQIEVEHPINAVGITSLVWLLFFIMTSCVQLVRPFPFGFDALSLYMNMASLLHDYKGLVEGFQPYNWSILMAVGYIVFEKTEFALGISQLGTILSLFALFALCRRWLNTNYSLLTLLLFYSLPAVIFQTYKDMKIDMGLLFVTLTIVIIFINWIEQIVKQESYIPNLSELAQSATAPDTSNVSFWEKHQLIVLSGILAGFALGIKFTALFLIIGVIGGIWYVHSGKAGLATAFLLSFAVVLIARIDDMSGARAYHLSANVMQWVLLLLGVILLVMLLVSKRQQVLQSIRASVLFGSLLLLSFVHWPVKNIVESDQISVRSLLFGKSTGPDVSPGTIIQQWDNRNK